MGTVASTTSITAHNTANGFDNDQYTMTDGGATNPGDIRITGSSDTYLGASAGANVWFTGTAGDRGFAIEGIDASSFTSLKVQFGYRKESGASLPTLALDYWDGSTYVNVPFTFNEVAGASAGWYLSPEIALPVGAQIENLRLRFVKSGSVAVRIDDVVLKGVSIYDASAPGLTIDGTLTFDGAAARDVAVTGNITIGAGGTFISQAAGAFTNILSVTGDISNAGVLDFSRAGTTLVCDVTFNKNGNQTVSGAGATTRFHNITLDMGAVNTNILEITTSNFSAPDGFLEIANGTPNRLKNGTLKLSGSFTYSGCPFILNSEITIVSTAGLWINNSNVTITPIAGSYRLAGLLHISSGTFNVGTSLGNSIDYISGATILIDGGAMNVAARISSSTAGDLSYTQSAGTVTLNTASNTSTYATLSLPHASSEFHLTGGTLVIRNEKSTDNGFDIDIANITSSIGGTIQLADASSGTSFTRGF